MGLLDEIFKRLDINKVVIQHKYRQYPTGLSKPEREVPSVSTDWTKLIQMAKASETLEDLKKPLAVLENTINAIEGEIAAIRSGTGLPHSEEQQYIDVLVTKLRNRMTDVYTVINRYR